MQGTHPEIIDQCIYREAPDPVERAIRFLTCYPIAEGAVYHCCRNYDHMPANIGRFGQGYVSFEGRKRFLDNFKLRYHLDLFEIFAFALQVS